MIWTPSIPVGGPDDQPSRYSLSLHASDNVNPRLISTGTAPVEDANRSPYTLNVQAASPQALTDKVQTLLNHLYEAVPAQSLLTVEPTPAEQMSPIEDALLGAVARANAALPGCIDIRWATTVDAIEAQANGVSLNLANSLGRGTLQADWVVACDGGQSFVRNSLGLQLEGTAYTGRYVIVAGHRRVLAFKRLLEAASTEAERQRYATIPATLKLALDNQRLNPGRQFEQPHEIGDVAARFVHDLGKRFLRMAVIIHQPSIGLRLFNRVQILTLNILDKRDFQRLGIIKITNNDGYFMQACPLRRPPAPFTRDDLKPLAQRADDNRLDQAARRNRISQFVKRRLFEATPRLTGMGRQ